MDLNVRSLYPKNKFLLFADCRIPYRREVEIYPKFESLLYADRVISVAIGEWLYPKNKFLLFADPH